MVNTRKMQLCASSNGNCNRSTDLNKYHDTCNMKAKINVKP